MRPDRLTLLHSSDLHGDLDRLLLTTEPFDLWLDTGDFFPNSRPPGPEPYDDRTEREHQLRWLTAHGRLTRLTQWLGSRPLLTVAGNHDHADLGLTLREAGLTVHRLTPHGLTQFGYRWAGFREVPALRGDGVGETNLFETIFSDIQRTQPELLATHAPAAGVLDPGRGLAIPGLAERLRELPDLRLHLFGHEHRTGGQQLTVDRYTAINGATCVSLLTLTPHGPPAHRVLSTRTEP